MALFKTPANIFVWKDIKTFLLRNQYNEALQVVIKDYFTKQYISGISNAPFLNTNYCLTLTKFEDKCGCGTNYDNGLVILKTTANTFKEEDKNLENARTEFEIAQRNWNFEYKKFELQSLSMTAKENAELKKLEEAIAKRSEVKKTFDAVLKALNSNASLSAELGTLSNWAIQFEEKDTNLKKIEADKKLAAYKSILESEEKKNEYENALALYTIAQRNFDFTPTATNQQLQANAKNHFEQVESNYRKATSSQRGNYVEKDCHDTQNTKFCLPPFEYLRKLSLSVPIKDKSGNAIPASDFDFMTHGLTVGSVIWLYYYERMGIFKILGALMDDYNYRGKYTISGSRNNDYSALMDMVCTWHRLGMSSNLRDRICLYQRTLGVSIENNLGVESERNTGFMGTFNKLLDYMLEYYKDKRLAVAINNASTGRSSVATQTSIRDTIKLLQQQFEPFEYGRNQINTFLGLATVHATICLLYNIRKEIGVPDQYESPDEFIPAAYDILVAKRAITLNETNRFIVYDNCASYGYRLLTDLQTIDMAQLQASATGGIFDLWLDDVEGWVEGYRSAYGSVPEKVEAIV